MSTLALLDINPDELFEKNSIHEIDLIQRKLLTNIERKREELRTMVGERYRDLIHAADTIAEMKVTSEHVVRHIAKINNTCEKSPDNGFLKVEKVDYKKDKPQAYLSKYSVVIQIHIMISIPEKIWRCIENANYLEATQLYLFALHVSTGVQIRISETEQSSRISNWKELSQNHCNIIISFKDNIRTACQNALKSSDLSTEETVYCLCSICLLDDISLPEVLNLFITLRLEALQKILSLDVEHYNVKAKVMDSANLLINTILLVYNCFIGETNSRICKELEKLMDNNVLSSVSMLKNERSIIGKALPDDILNFRPRVEIVNISTGTLQQTMVYWLQNIESDVSKKLSVLISLVSSVKSLQGIKSNFCTAEKPPLWEDICNQLFVPDMIDIFGKYYQPLLTTRIEWLIRDTWSSALTKIKDGLKVVIKSSNKQSKNIPWKETQPQKYSVNCNAKENVFKLVNLYGFNADIIALCDEFDTCVKTLLEELFIYLYDSNIYEERFNRKEMGIDTQHLLCYIQEHSVESIDKLMKFIKEECLNSQSAILLSRFLTSLILLCPNLSQCFRYEASGNFQDVIYNKINTLNLECWNKWLENTDVLVRESIKKIMPKEFSSRTLLTILSQWDMIKIQEKDDQENSIESSIKIPLHTSLPLQNILNLINSHIILIQPHTLPNSIRQQLILNVANHILDYYENVSQNEDLRSKQNLALQFYLDVKYLQLLMLQRDKKSAMEKFQRVADNFKSIVDPFDFDVFYPYLQNNIKKAAQKTQMQMGFIVSNPEQLSTILGTPNATQDIPCIIPLVNSQNNQGNTSYWFTLLPITAQSSTTFKLNKNPVDKSQSIKASGLKQNTDIPKMESAGTSGLVRSGAAAFFGAMGQDWFGSH